MKIGFISSEAYPVPPVKGGAVEQWIYEVAKRLTDHEVYCFSMDDPLLKGYLENEGFKLCLYKKGFFGKLLLATYKLPFKQYHSELYFLPFALWCGWKAKQLKLDILHIHSRPHFVRAIRFINKKVKIIVHIHNVSVVHIDNKKLWPKALWDQVSRIFCCSEYLKNEVIRRYPYLSDKCFVVYNGVDLHQFDPQSVSETSKVQLREQYAVSSSSKIIIFAGRLVEYKGVHVLIEAFIKLLKMQPHLHLFILGGVTYSNNQETPYISQLKEMARAYPHQITFTGFVPSGEMKKFLNLADLFVVPSIWEEPFGVVVIEAMAMAKAVVAFAKGGIKEIITNHVDGVLIQPVNVEALSESMSTLIAEDALRKQLGERARHTVQKRFDWPCIMSVLTNHYLEALKK